MMQYDLKDIAERIARIRQFESELAEKLDGLSHTNLVYGLLRIHVELGAVADLLPKVE